MDLTVEHQAGRHARRRLLRVRDGNGRRPERPHGGRGAARGGVVRRHAQVHRPGRQARRRLQHQPGRRHRARPGQLHGRYDESGTVKVRLPKGRLHLRQLGRPRTRRTRQGWLDWLVQPKLSVTKKITVTVDARTAKPVDITVPDAAAKSRCRCALYTVRGAGRHNSYGCVAGLVRQPPYGAPGPADHRRHAEPAVGRQLDQGRRRVRRRSLGGKVKQLAPVTASTTRRANWPR